MTPSDRLVVDVFASLDHHPFKSPVLLLTPPTAPPPLLVVLRFAWTRNNTHPAATGVESSSSGGGNVGSDPANPSRLMSSSSSRHLSHRHLSGELRDLARPIRPSWVVPCAVTTVHPQLRDLVACPRGRGELFVVEGKGVKRVVVDVAARTSSRAYARGGRDGESSESDNEDGEEEPEEDGWDDSSTSGATSGTRRSTLLWTPPQAGDEYMIWDQDGEGDDEDAIEHGDDDASTVGVRRGVMGGYVGGNAHHGRSKRGHHGGGRRHGGHADSRSIGQAGLRHDTRASSNRSGGEGRGGMYWTPNVSRTARKKAVISLLLAGLQLSAEPPCSCPATLNRHPLGSSSRPAKARSVTCRLRRIASPRRKPRPSPRDPCRRDSLTPRPPLPCPLGSQRSPARLWRPEWRALPCDLALG